MLSSSSIDAMNELDSQLTAENENSKGFKGGEGGDVGAEAGGVVEVLIEEERYRVK